LVLAVGILSISHPAAGCTTAGRRLPVEKASYTGTNLRDQRSLDDLALICISCLSALVVCA